MIINLGQYKKKSESTFSGLSGSPVFDIENNFVGIFCKISINKKNIFGFVLPTYYLIRTFEKNDNDSLYNVDIERFNDLKIGNYFVKSSSERNNRLVIFNPRIGYNLNLDVHFSLEGDKELSVLGKYITKKDESIVNINYIPNPQFDFRTVLIKEDLHVKLTQGLISYLKQNDFNFDKLKMNIKLPQGERNFSNVMINISLLK